MAICWTQAVHSAETHGTKGPGKTQQLNAAEEVERERTSD